MKEEAMITKNQLHAFSESFRKLSQSFEVDVSPRGALAWIRCAKAKAAMEGRDYVLPYDLKACAQPVLAHRLILGGLSLGSDRQAEAVLAQILEEIPVPVEKFQG